jgi:hypothetical protein
MSALKIAAIMILLLADASQLFREAEGQCLSVLAGARVPRNRVGDAIGVQPELGLRLFHQPSSYPLGIDAYLAGSFGDKETTVTPPGVDFVSGRFRMITLETGLGLRREGRGSGMRAHIAGGWAFSQVQTQERWRDNWHGTVEKYHAFGPWVGSGITWPTGRHTRVGVDGRFSAVNAERASYGKIISGGGVHIGLSVSRASR